MSYKTIFIGVAVLFIIGLVGYKTISFMNKMEVNTVSPQTSNSIEESRRNAFFKQAYNLDTIASLNKIDIREAWVEYVWKNSFNNGNMYKEKLGGVQLVINTNDFQSHGYSDKTFLVDWDIRLDKQELQGGGKGNGLYVFYLKDSIPPEQIKVVVNNKSGPNNKRIEIIFELKKSDSATH